MALKEQGYDVIGVTMQIWQDEDEFVQEENGGCCGLSAVDDARRVAERLEIPYYVMNFKKSSKIRSWIILWKNIYRAYTESLQCLQPLCQVGSTFRPCAFHRRRLYRDRSLCKNRTVANGRYAITNSVTAAKDQTYALYNLTQEQLSHTLMPVGVYHKIRSGRSRKIGLPVHTKGQSGYLFYAG